MPPPMMEVSIRYCLRSMTGQRRRKRGTGFRKNQELGEHRDRRDGRMGLEYAVVLLTDDDRRGGGAVDLTLLWQDLIDLFR